VRERAVRDDVDAIGGEAELLAQARLAVARVDDHRVHPLVQAPLGRALAGARLPRQDVVGGEDPRAPARQQEPVEVLDRQPLEVHEVRARGPVAQHVPRVARELGRQAEGLRAAGGQAPVEPLVDRVALRGGTSPWRNGEVTSVTSRPGARASAAHSARS
jgi:hypothetical protein